MTQRMMHDLGCACGRYFRRPLYHALDAQAHPGLRYAVLAGVLNVVQCPGCERIARVGLPFLYHDGAHGRFVYVQPDDDEAGEAGVDGSAGAGVRMMAAAFVPAGAARVPMVAPEAPRPTIVHGLERLVDLVLDDVGDEDMGVIAIDVRPGIRSERAARGLANSVAAEIGGYVHAWREGGRLHLQILGPSARMEEITISVD